MKPLLCLLPRELNYGESPEMTAIQNALTAAMGDVWDARDGFAAQLSPATATWGIDRWEAALGLVPPDRSSLDARRRAVIAKLRGAGTSTIERISSVAEAQLGGVVWVREFPGEYRIEIWTRGMAVPDGSFAALTNALKELMPAHLRWSYGAEYPATPFVNSPDEFTLHRFILSLAFSNLRSFLPFRLDGSVPLDGSALLDAAPASLFGLPRLTVGGAMPALRDRLEQRDVRFTLGTPPLKRPDALALRRFVLALAFSEQRTFIPFRLDGSAPLDGSWLLDAAPSSLFAFPRFTVGCAVKNRMGLSRAALTVDTMWTLDGSVLLDGSRKLGADITKEEL